jgi:hypothetical protein
MEKKKWEADSRSHSSSGCKVGLEHVLDCIAETARLKLNVTNLVTFSISQLQSELIAIFSLILNGARFARYTNQQVTARRLGRKCVLRAELGLAAVVISWNRRSSQLGKISNQPSWLDFLRTDSIVPSWDDFI